MAQKLVGMLNLSKISKELIFTTQKGEKAVFVEIVPNKNGADQWGNTHSAQIYNKDTRTTTYLGNFKPQEFGKAAAPASHDEAATDDLPFD